MELRYLEHPVLKELDPIIKEMKERLDLQAATLDEMLISLNSLLNTVSSLEKQILEASHKAHSAYRRSEEIERTANYGIDELRRKIRV